MYDADFIVFLLILQFVICCSTCLVKWLFQVFGSCPAGDMLEKFPDVLQFCGHVSRLMVSEIRRRASNQSTG
jgi:hypothetical protein